MNHPVTDFILKLLREKGKTPEQGADHYNYVATGHIDSLGLIKFFLRIEEQFGVTIEPSDIADPSIRTVGGLAALISQKLAEKAPPSDRAGNT